MIKWINDINTTSFRIVVSVVLAVVVVLLIIGGMMIGRPVDTSVLQAILIFLSVMMGLDVTTFIAKRVTHKDPGTPTVVLSERAPIVLETPTNAHRSPGTPSVEQS